MPAIDPRSGVLQHNTDKSTPGYTLFTPLGLYNCPAHRGVDKALIGAKDAYKDSDSMAATAEATKGILDRFDASKECDKVTCLYNSTNWWIEGLIESGELPEALPDKQDYFL